MMENPESMETQGDMRWYVVHAYSGFEKSVAQALRDRIARADMQVKVLEQPAFALVEGQLLIRKNGRL